MISHKFKCIFIHIPKCAGTSIENALGHFDGHFRRGGQDHRSIKMIEQPFLTTKIFSSKENFINSLRRIRYKLRSKTNPNNKQTVSKKQYDDYFKFTFIRNPWSRAFSWYKNVMADEIHKQKYRITELISLNEFLRHYKGKGMLRPQTYWIVDFSGSIPLDYIGRFENLIKDFQEVCKLMKIPPIKLPHSMKGSQEDYREYYDNESIDIIRETYKEEIALFGYSFEN